jgi:(p)ppGpp synthase/HD superfamily hydrolase
MTAAGKPLSSRAGRPPIDAGRARALAESLHDGQRDEAGAPLIEHVRRVAAAVSRDARVVA